MVKDATPVSRIKRPNGGSGFIRFQHPDASYRQYLGRNRRGNLERLDRLARAENLMVHGPDSRRVRLVKSLLESRISTWNEMKAAGSKSPSLAAGHDRFDARSMERLNERIAAARAENAAAQAKGAGVPKKPRRMSDATIQRNLD